MRGIITCVVPVLSDELVMPVDTDCLQESVERDQRVWPVRQEEDPLCGKAEVHEAVECRHGEEGGHNHAIDDVPAGRAAELKTRRWSAYQCCSNTMHPSTH